MGQVELVTAMATSGRRLQLAIAPAGAGKTTAMQALTTAWTASGGTVLGLAPSAAAAAQLREQTGTTTETLAKLTWSITHHDLPRWAQQIGSDNLLVIDEAGMADTLSLAQVCAWAVERGASVRLIGDTQQLAAIGAGGALRDIQTTHGSVQLTELMRFTDTAESAASLALRDGNTSALGFYLDQQRVHVGDLATMTDHAFTAWRTDTDQGLDSIMLAPTRQLVAELNQRARQHRLDQQPDTPRGRECVLADGCTASAGDTVITRSNDRRLRISRTDWVKNGDRWTIQQVTRQGDLQVPHAGTGRLVTLPRDYVTASVELGYATTVHSAQGVSVDTMHGVATGDESRQQFYTMMTRGRHANHVWLQVVGDGDDDTLIRPEGITPPTPTDALEAILARDESPTSATTLLHQQADPRLLLGDATQRYLDGLTVAAEHHLGKAYVTALDGRAEQLLPGISEAPAWPTLRAHLLLLGAQDINPLDRLAGRDRSAEPCWCPRCSRPAVVAARRHRPAQRTTRDAAVDPRHPRRAHQPPDLRGLAHPTLPTRGRPGRRGPHPGASGRNRPGVGAHRCAPTTCWGDRRRRSVAGRDASRTHRHAAHRTRGVVPGRPRLATPAQPANPPRHRPRDGRMGRAPHADQPGHHHRRLPSPARRKPRRTRPDRV